MSLSAAGGPIGRSPFGRFSEPLPEELAYIEPHPRLIRATIDGDTVLETEGALMVHRPGHPLAYAFPIGAIADLPNEPEPLAPGYVQVPWDAVDQWIEEGRRLVHYPPNPYHRVDCRPTSRRLRVEVGGVTLVDTHDTVILFETALDPKLYVDPARARTDLLRRTGTTTYCNYKGDATYWAAEIDGEVFDDVAWSYEEPLPESLPIAGMLSFDPTRATVDAELPRDAAAIAMCST